VTGQVPVRLSPATAAERALVAEHDRIEYLVEASPLGTPGAKMLRDRAARQQLLAEIADQLADIIVTLAEFEDMTTAPASCPAVDRGFYCTRAAGHPGDHLAGAHDHAAHRWPTAEPTRIPDGEEEGEPDLTYRPAAVIPPMALLAEIADQLADFEVYRSGAQFALACRECTTWCGSWCKLSLPALIATAVGHQKDFHRSPSTTGGER
jgi:hypothetical protein